jgi:hypothetical protein
MLEPNLHLLVSEDVQRARDSSSCVRWMSFSIVVQNTFLVLLSVEECRAGPLNQLNSLNLKCHRFLFSFPRA